MPSNFLTCEYIQNTGLVEMNDIEVQTEEIEEPGPNPAEEDLIRLQSSMCEIQEDFTRERQMLKDQIAQLQVHLCLLLNSCKTIL